METNARFREERAGLISEALGDWIQIVWDPIAETASVTFETNRYLKVDDQYITRMDGSMEESIVIDHINLAGRSYEINGKVVSGVDVDMFVRLLYDELYNEIHNSAPPEDSVEPDPDDPNPGEPDPLKRP